jgi:predicted alpha/beta hydrolase family esterase
VSKKVLILHGWGGSNYPHWQTLTAIELIKKDYIVSFPQFPNKDMPNLDEWLKFLADEFKHFKPDIVVCHSLANILWFHFIEKYNIKIIEKLMIVAPVSQKCKIDDLKTFFPYPISENLKAKEVIMVGSSNDPYMTIDEVMDLQSQLNIGLKILDDAGHINANSGYGELSCVVKWIERESEL